MGVGPVVVVVDGIFVVGREVAGSPMRAMEWFCMLDVWRHREIRRQSSRTIAKCARIFKIKEVPFGRAGPLWWRRRNCAVRMPSVGVAGEWWPPGRLRRARLVPDPWHLGRSNRLVRRAANQRIRADEAARLFPDLFDDRLAIGLRWVRI